MPEGLPTIDPKSRAAALAGDPLWYKDAVIYQLNVKAFLDSNDDGVGDFRGVAAKLDYVKELGVNTIWLMPFYPSPLKDDGYDISEYEDVHPQYGTLDDFRLMLAEAHKRDLKVITELVINHTSDRHPWFQRARRAALNHGCWSEVWLTTSSVNTRRPRSCASRRNCLKSRSVP